MLWLCFALKSRENNRDTTLMQIVANVPFDIVSNLTIAPALVGPLGIGNRFYVSVIAFIC